MHTSMCVCQRVEVLYVNKHVVSLRHCGIHVFKAYYDPHFGVQDKQLCNIRFGL